MSAIPQGSLVLVTGANGYIASHVVDQFLAAGYRVRGTVRSDSKGAWVKELFDKKYGPNRFELAIVADFEKIGAFDDAMKDAAGVAHVAANLMLNVDDQKLSFSEHVQPGVTAAVNYILDSAAATPSVKRFIMTSSSMAATNPKPGVKFTITDKTWNYEVIEAARAPPPYDARRWWDIYGASKTLAEQELWKFLQDHKDVNFVANTILPNTNFGPFLSPENQASGNTASWVSELYKNGLSDLKKIPAQYFVDVRDTARLHVAALTDADIQNERVFAFAEPFNWNAILRTLRKVRPNHEFPSDSENDEKDLSIIALRARAEEILLKNFGQKGFTALEETLEANIAHLD